MLLCDFADLLLDLAELGLHGVDLILKLSALSSRFVHAIRQFFDESTNITSSALSLSHY